MPLLLFTLIVIFILSLIFLYEKLSKTSIPHGARPLPGPKGLREAGCLRATKTNTCQGFPLIGRVHDIPAEKTWLKFYEWSREYGPIYQQNMFGSVNIWITSEEIAHELLSKRAGTYSDRPMIPNLPNNKYAGEYFALHGHNGKCC